MNYKISELLNFLGMLFWMWGFAMMETTLSLYYFHLVLLVCLSESSFALLSY